jgi:hypothetical protein
VVNEHIFVRVLGPELFDHFLCVCTLRLVHLIVEIDDVVQHVHDEARGDTLGYRDDD